jgi:hypothetical protein
MLSVEVCQFFLLMLSFTWGKCYSSVEFACMLLLLDKFSMQKKEKKTMDSFPSFKQLLGAGMVQGLGFRV